MTRPSGQNEARLFTGEPAPSAAFPAVEPNPVWAQLVCAPCFRSERDLIEFGDHFRWKFKCRGRQVFAKMSARRCPGNYENVGSALKQPCQRDLHGCRLQGCGSRIERCRLER